MIQAKSLELGKCLSEPRLLLLLLLHVPVCHIHLEFGEQEVVLVAGQLSKKSCSAD